MFSIDNAAGLKAEFNHKGSLRHLRLHDVSLELIGVEIDGARQRGLRFIEPVFVQQETCALEMQFGILGREQYGAIDRLLGSGDIAVDALGMGQQGVGAGVVRRFGHGHTGQRHGFGVGAAAQGFENSFLHGGSGDGGAWTRNRLVYRPDPVAQAQTTTQAGNAADNRAVTQRSA